jgi:hypothetical protein
MIDPSTLDNIAYNVGWFEQATLTEELKLNELYTVEAVEEALMTSAHRREMWDVMVKGLVSILSQLLEE